MKTKPASATAFHVVFVEATAELMERKTRKKLMAAGVVLYAAEPGGCWTVVSHAPDNSGYARAGREGKTRLLHRVAWEQQHGPTPKGQRVFQYCGNRRCVNPEHLRLMTPTEIRQEDMTRRLEDAELTQAPLNREQVELIRRLVHFGATRRTVTLAFGISRQHFKDILGLG